MKGLGNSQHVINTKDTKDTKEKPVRHVLRPGVVIFLLLVALASRPTQAHKPITSKYTYNADVFPIFRDRCGACHAAGGAGPMSLLNYNEAVPWAESIREELIDEKMPPWYVDPSRTRVKGAKAISPREIDTIVTWATGGTPEGDVSRRPVPAALSKAWPAGTPDLVIAMDADYTVPAEKQEELHEIVLPTSFESSRWVTLADLQPGAPDMVRDATMAVENGPLLAAWTPGEPPERTPAGTAFELPAHARIRLRIHYKKPWEDERKTRSDRSRIGLYFAAQQPTVRAVETLSIDSTSSGAASEPPQTMASVMPSAASVVSFRPLLDQPYAELDVQAVLVSGARVPLLRLHRPRPEWSRRYWLDAPIDLPAGSRVEVRATPAPIDPDEPPRVRSGALGLAVEYVRR
jgi:mono/diheme cytochrome c family protein